MDLTNMVADEATLREWSQRALECKTRNHHDEKGQPYKLSLVSDRTHASHSGHLCSLWSCANCKLFVEKRPILPTYDVMQLQFTI